MDHGPGWVIKIFAAKYHAVEGSWRVVDRALDLAGGFGIFKKGPFEQLFRDARLGRIHPANSMLGPHGWYVRRDGPRHYHCAGPGHWPANHGRWAS